LIGDSINDYKAADVNGIKFYGFNNVEIKNKCNLYLDDFSIIANVDNTKE